MTPSKADIWLVNLGGAMGHEQKKERPAIMWRDMDHMGLAILVPLTSKIERSKLPHTYVVSPSLKNGLDHESVALIYQITTVDKKLRFVRKLGELEETDIKAIAGLIKDMLKL